MNKLHPLFWYLIIAVFSGLVFVYTLWKKRDSRLIPLYTFMGGLTYLFEYIILVLLSSYRYYPHILKEPYYDSVLGAVISDAFVIPVTAVFIAAFNLGLLKILILSGLITGIEILFVYLGIFEHVWWKFYFTSAGLLAAFYIAKGWYRLIKKPLSLFVQLITLYITNLLFQASVVFILLAIFHKYFYSVNWFVDPVRSHSAFAMVYILILSAIFVFLVVFSLKWIWVIAGIGLMFLMDVILLKLNILQLSESWSLGHFLIFYSLIYLALLYFNRIFLSNKQSYIKLTGLAKKYKKSK